MNEGRDTKKKKSKKISAPPERKNSNVVLEKKAPGGGTKYKELRLEAKNLGIPRYSQMRKGELSKAISYRKTHPKVRFGARPKKKVTKVTISPGSRSARTRNEKEIPKDKPLLPTKILREERSSC